jgi:hypothetical protein
MLRNPAALVQGIVMSWRPERVELDLSPVETGDEGFDAHFNCYANCPAQARAWLYAVQRRRLLGLKRRGTPYAPRGAKALESFLQKGGRPPCLRQPYFWLSIRGTTLFWGRLTERGWLPVRLAPP